MLFCLGWDATWKGPVSTALYTTTDPTLHRWTQKNASFFSPHYGGGGSFWQIPGVPATAPVSHMLSADFHGDGHGTFALGRYDPDTETFDGVTERGGVVDFSPGVRYFELGASPAAPGSVSEVERLMMVGWTTAGTSMSIVRELGFDQELKQLIATPATELTTLRGARIDAGTVEPGKTPLVLAPKQRFEIAGGAAARTADVELNFTVPAGDWQTTVEALGGRATLTLSGSAVTPRAVLARVTDAKAPYQIALKPSEATITVRLLSDKVIAEFFVQGGRAVGTVGVPGGVDASSASLAVTADLGQIRLNSVMAWAMGCGWV